MAQFSVAMFCYFSNRSLFQLLNKTVSSVFLRTMCMRKLLLLTSLIALSACNNDTSVFIEDDNNIGSLPSIPPSPEHNPTTDEKVTLGKLLFWDPILSGNKDIACASCHHPDHGYAENIDLSIGVGGSGLSENRHSGKLIHRNAPTILNAAFNGMDEDGAVNPLNSPMFWDNRATPLEESFARFAIRR